MIEEAVEIMIEEAKPGKKSSFPIRSRYRSASYPSNSNKQTNSSPVLSIPSGSSTFRPFIQDFRLGHPYEYDLVCKVMIGFSLIPPVMNCVGNFMTYVSSLEKLDYIGILLQPLSMLIFFSYMQIFIESGNFQFLTFAQHSFFLLAVINILSFAYIFRSWEAVFVGFIIMLLWRPSVKWTRRLMVTIRCKRSLEELAEETTSMLTQVAQTIFALLFLFADIGAQLYGMFTLR